MHTDHFIQKKTLPFRYYSHEKNIFLVQLLSFARIPNKHLITRQQCLQLFSYLD